MELPIKLYNKSWAACFEDYVLHRMLDCFWEKKSRLQGLKFAVSRYPWDIKNMVLDTKLWMMCIPTGKQKNFKHKEDVNTFDRLLIVF